MERFVDKVRIRVKGGRGGNGAVAFLREKRKPWGGPAGGDGGKGGDVILVASSSVKTLLDLKDKRVLKAQDGEHGKGKKMHGKDGEDLIVYVPVGTVVKDAETGKILADLVREGDSVVVARGGKGGRGNAHFADSVWQAPRYAEKGKPGEERLIELEVKLIADVGIVGLPNAGKSTLLARLTRARPKIAPYPFTTLSPNLGVLELDPQRRLVLADIPGIIEEAHKGKGLGHDFLRHIERTRVLLHLIDISDFAEVEPKRAFEIVSKELELYSKKLAQKPRLVVGNKIDSLSNRSRIDELERFFKEKGFDFLAISAITGEGLDRLKEKIWELYSRAGKS